MTDHPHPLELSAPEMRALVEAALDRIVDQIESLPEQPLSDTRGGFEVAQSLAEPLPGTGTAVAELLDLFFERALPPTMNTASPGYLAYIPGGRLFHAAVADLIADSMNRYSSIYASAPALARIEMNVIDWFCELAGYPPEARGTLTSGGSLANWTALVTARRERLPENFLKGTLYVSDQSHHSVAKGALLAGFPEGNVREVPTDDLFRLRPDALETLVEEDRRRRLPGAVGGEARPRPAGGGPPARDGGDRDARRAAALAPRLPARSGGSFRDGARRAQSALPRAHQRPPAGLPHPHAPAREIRPAHLRPLLPHPPGADRDGAGGHRGGAAGGAGVGVQIQSPASNLPWRGAHDQLRRVQSDPHPGGAVRLRLSGSTDSRVPGRSVGR